MFDVRRASPSALRISLPPQSFLLLQYCRTHSKGSPMTTAFQSLEPRLCLSGSLQNGAITWGDRSVSLTNHILTIRGGAANDNIRFSVPASSLQAPGNSKFRVRINDNSATFSFTDIRQIHIDARGGNDQITVLPT